MIVLLRLTRKKQPKMQKIKTLLKERQFKEQQMDSKRKQEGDGFPCSMKFIRVLLCVKLDQLIAPFKLIKLIAPSLSN